MVCWKMDHFISDVPSKTSVYREFSIAMFDYQRVSYSENLLRGLIQLGFLGFSQRYQAVGMRFSPGMYPRVNVYIADIAMENGH